MSDSSSSDEENDCFKEAVDPTFFSNDLFQPKKKEITNEKPAKLPPSRRNQHQTTSTFNPLEIRVTPEFRSYVSKHLHKLLDKTIDDTEELEVNRKRKLKSKTKHASKGVKLLRTSNDFLKDVGEECDAPQKRKHKKKKRRRLDDDSDSGDEERRAREVAVTADWILSGKATEGWAPCTKGKVEVVVVESSKKCHD